ncbi:MAG: hypothetical protein WBC44_22975 [Planctomycetaceae bacterium]
MFRRLVSSSIDEAFGLMLLHKVLRFGDRPPALGPADVPHLRSGDPRTFFSPVPEPADLASNRRKIAETEHAVVEDFTFVSPVSTPFPRNNVVRGRHWRVKASGGCQPPENVRQTASEPARRADAPRSPRRTLVLVDGLVQYGYGSERLFAERLNPAGIDVVTIDLPFNHHRTPTGYRPGQLIVGGDLDHTLGVLRQAVLDTWALVRGLQTEGRDVALAGISFGGWTVLSTALVASGLAGVTAIAPPIDMLRVLTEGGVIVRAARRGLGLSPAQFASLRTVAKAVTPSAWPSPLPSGRVFLHAADYDRFVPTPRIVRSPSAGRRSSCATLPDICN